MKLPFVIIGILASLNLFAPVHTGDFISEWEHYKKVEAEYQKRVQTEKFLDAIAFSESSGRYTVYNRYGYIGKYQFGYSARKATGYDHVHFADFVRDPSVWAPEQQDSAMVRLLRINENHLHELIQAVEAEDVVIRGVKITKSGILAGAHLAGFAGVKRYFAQNNNARDVYGTSVEDYIVKFSGYSI